MQEQQSKNNIKYIFFKYKICKKPIETTRENKKIERKIT